MDDFRGRVAVVTGAASGIGRGIAERCAAEGMSVVLADVERPALEQAERELTDDGATVLAVPTDVSDAASVEALAQQTIDRFGAVHLLCNNAGVAGGGGMMSWDTPIESWQWTIGVNLWGVVHGVRAFVPKMLECGDEAHIVNTASIAGLVAGAGGPAYTASKFGVIGFSETLYHELQYVSGGKIGVSVLCPAMTNTRILESSRNYPSGELPMPAEGTPERAMFDMIKHKFADEGMAPSEVARQVFDAVREKRFYILTHPAHNPLIVKRAEAIADASAPPILTPG